MKYSVCITTSEVSADIPLALFQGSFDEKTAKAGQVGYDGVELVTAEPLLLDIIAISDSVLAGNLEISAISSGALASSRGLTLLASDDKTRTTARKRLSKLIQFAGKTGAGIVTIGSFRGRASSVGGKVQAVNILTEILKDASAEAGSLNVEIALEPINRFDSDFLNNAEETLSFIENTCCANLGILLDTFHMNIEEPSFTGSIRNVMAKGFLRHIHIGDSNRLPPGKGHIDFSSIIKTLTKCGYSGYLSAELLTGSTPDETAEETINSMRKFELLSEAD